MKKLMLWLSLVLAIGLSAQTAKAYDIPGTLYVGYALDDNGSWVFGKTMTKDGNDFVYTFPYVNSDLYFVISKRPDLTWKDNNAGGFKENNCIYTCGGGSSNDTAPVSPEGNKLYAYGDCYHVLVLNGKGCHSIRLTPNSNEGNENGCVMSFNYTTLQDFYIGYNPKGGDNDWKKQIKVGSAGSWSYTIEDDITTNTMYFYVTATGKNGATFSGGWPDKHFTTDAYNNVAMLKDQGTRVSLQGRNDHVLYTNQDVKGKKVTLHFDTNGNGEQYIWYTCEEKETPVDYSKVNMPLKPADFANGKKHYFLVGSRMADWRLQPEWEFTVKNGNTLKIDGARVMYDGRVEIGVVDNYDDYINQRYYRWGSNENSYCVHLNNRNIAGLVLKDNNKYNYYNDRYGSDRWCPNPGDGNGDYFRATTDGGALYGDAILQSKGAVAQTIELKIDNNGNPTEWYFTIPNNNPTDAQNYVSKYLTFSLVGGNIINEGMADANKTPKNTSDWQSAWVQYDAQGQPYRDAKGSLMFQTVFQPEWLDKHPTFFNKKVNGDDFNYTSRNIVMQNVSQMDAEELANDPYAALYNRFDNDSNKNIGGSRSVNAGDFSYTEKIMTWDANIDQSDRYEDKTARSNNNWQCFVVKDMWIDGSFKIWTGWGGGFKGNENVQIGDPASARWYYVNGGHGQGKGSANNTAEEHSIKGYDISQPGGEVTVYGTRRDKDGANFKVDNLTYFKRVIVWYDPAKDFDNSVIQLIVEKFGPNIQAFRASGSSIRYDWNVPDLGLSGPEKNFGVQSYQITRYILNSKGEWVVDEVKPEEVVNGTKTVGDFANAISATDTKLPSGTYRYDVVFTYNNGTEDVTRTAVSNEITLYDASVPVTIHAYQRVVDANAQDEVDTDSPKVNYKRYSFDSVLELDLTDAAKSAMYDGKNVTELVKGYAIVLKADAKRMDHQVATLYINGTEVQAPITDPVDEAKRGYKNFRTPGVNEYVYKDGAKYYDFMKGGIMEVLFADYDNNPAITLRWENCTNETPGTAMDYEVYLIPNEDNMDEFAAAQFGFAEDEYKMTIPTTTIRWTDAGIAKRPLDYDMFYGDNGALDEETRAMLRNAMPMGTHNTAGETSDMDHPILYPYVNYLYADATFSRLPITASVYRGFDVNVRTGLTKTDMHRVAVNPTTNTIESLHVEDIDFDDLIREIPIDDTPGSRQFYDLKESNGGIPSLTLRAYKQVYYDHKISERWSGDENAMEGDVVDLLSVPLIAPLFEVQNTQVNGTFLEGTDKNIYSVHNLYVELNLQNNTPSTAEPRSLLRRANEGEGEDDDDDVFTFYGDGLYFSTGFHVSSSDSTVDLGKVAEADDTDKASNGGVVATSENTYGFEVTPLEGYTDTANSKDNFTADNNWSRIATEAGYIPVVATNFASAQSETQLHATDMTGVTSTVAYHYPFMSGTSLVTLTTTTEKPVTINEDNVATGIESVGADVVDGETVYYNLQGIRVMNPAKGDVYLMVTPRGVQKIRK